MKSEIILCLILGAAGAACYEIFQDKWSWTSFMFSAACFTFMSILAFWIYGKFTKSKTVSFAVFKDAREKLGALPTWVKNAIVAQAIFAGVFGYLGLIGVMSVQMEQVKMLANVIGTLPQNSEAHKQLVHVAEIAAQEGNLWLDMLTGGLIISATIGVVIVGITPRKSRSNG